MTSRLSGKQESFERKQDFKPSARRSGWVCNICPVDRNGQLQFATLKAALKHEQTSREHARHVSERQWWNQSDESGWDGSGDLNQSLTSEGLRQWEMNIHVDQVFDLVPFWRRAVGAAERGEVLRLEEFLEKMEGGGGWRTANEVLGMLGEGGKLRLDGANDFASERGAISVEGASVGTERTWGGEWDVEEVKAAGRCSDMHEFVETVARQTAVNEERRKQMHKFFEMPTEQKVQKIQETINFLHNYR